MLLKTSYKMKPPISARLNTGHPLADKLIACYLFNEGSGLTAFDSSGRGHNGTLTGGATWTMGKYGPAVDLDGTDGHIVIPDHADFTPTLSPFCIAVDVCMHDATNCQLASKGLLDTDAEWRYGTLGSDLLLTRRFDESVDTCYVGRKYNTAMTGYENKWINAAVTSDGGVSVSSDKLYINGVRVDDANSISNAIKFVAVENLTHDVWLGRYGTGYANGVIGNVMFWRRALTNNEIKKLYADRFCMFERRQRLLVSVSA